MGYRVKQGGAKQDRVGAGLCVYVCGEGVGGRQTGDV